MKRVAFIYSGDDNGLSSLEYNRDGVAQKLKDFGDWEIAVNRKLVDESVFIADIQKYKDDELDALLIYYTGHGTHLEPSQKFQLKLSPSLGISLDILYARIYENFSDLPIKIAFVLDACYSGETIYNSEEFGTSEILASSLPNRKSFEIGFPKDVTSKMSLFSHYFCEAIEKLPCELESVNLLHIRNHINKFVQLQQSPYSFKTAYDEEQMEIAQGSVKEKFLGDIETIYVYFYPKNSNYEVVINNNPVVTVKKEEIDLETIQKEIIDYIQALLIPFIETKIELVLPKELYGVSLPLWRDHITSECETLVRSHTKFELADKWLPNLKKMWDIGHDECQNRAFGSEEVSTKVQCEAMKHPSRISAIVTNVAKETKVFDGIDKFYLIALWINECNDESLYHEFIEGVSSEKLVKVASKIRTKIIDNASNCSSNISFMWDNPYTLKRKVENYG